MIDPKLRLDAITAVAWWDPEQLVHAVLGWWRAYRAQIQALAPNQWEAFAAQGASAATLAEYSDALERFISAAAGRDKRSTAWGQPDLGETTIDLVRSAPTYIGAIAARRLEELTASLGEGGGGQVRQGIELAAGRALVATMLKKIKAEKGLSERRKK
jgi:hypothetical protein